MKKYFNDKKLIIPAYISMHNFSCENKVILFDDYR